MIIWDQLTYMHKLTEIFSVIIQVSRGALIKISVYEALKIVDCGLYFCLVAVLLVDCIEKLTMYNT